MQWKTINGEKPKKGFTEIEVLLRGMCNQKRILDIIRNFIVFEKDKDVKKKVAQKYDLPERFILSLSTLEPRKNIINLIKPIFRIIHKTDSF